MPRQRAREKRRLAINSVVTAGRQLQCPSTNTTVAERREQWLPLPVISHAGKTAMSLAAQTTDGRLPKITPRLPILFDEGSGGRTGFEVDPRRPAYIGYGFDIIDDFDEDDTSPGLAALRRFRGFHRHQAPAAIAGDGALRRRGVSRPGRRAAAT